MGYSSMETEGAHSHNLPPLLRLLGLLLLQPPLPPGLHPLGSPMLRGKDDGQ